MTLRKLGAGFAVAAVALVGSFGSAVADGMPGRGYGGACCFTWTGLYVGAHIGRAWDHVDWANVNLTGERVNNDASGFIGGGQIGYNLQAGNVVFGIEATLSRTNVGDDYTSAFNPFVTYSTDINWTGSVVGRLGFAHDRFLVYARAGWATANIQLSGNNAQLGDGFSGDDQRHGWVVGGGVEYAFSRNLSLGIEYNYMDLGSVSYGGFTAVGFPIAIRDVDVDVHSVTARLNFRFGGDHARPLK
jgi:outer membrane immunogenic protein